MTVMASGVNRSCAVLFYVTLTTNYDSEEKSMSGRLKWGILGTGNIARLVGNGVKASEKNDIVAVASRSIQSAETFAGEFQGCRPYGSYEELLADDNVDLVYITTPHPLHQTWATAAVQAGKNVLCEKPVTLNAADAREVIDRAAKQDVFFMEAFMYRCHPQTHLLCKLIREGEVGEVRLIQTTFSFHAAFRPEWRLFNKELGGGAILDVGCYCTSMARLLAGAALGRAFAEPVAFHATGHVGSTGVDEWSAAVCRFDNDILGQLSCGIALQQENVVRVIGSEGSIRVARPWNPSPKGEDTVIEVSKRGRPEALRIPVKDGRGTYTIEADAIADAIAGGLREYDYMTWQDTLANMSLLDQWRNEVGVRYS